MNDTDRNMLKAIFDSQSKLRQDHVKLRKEMNNGFENINSKIDKVEKNLTNRIDNIGSQVAYLVERKLASV